MELMDAGKSWREANDQSELNYSRRGIQQLYQRWRAHGAAALLDQRHGHVYKAPPEVRQWLRTRCTAEETVRATQLVSEIQAQFEVALNPNYVTALRHQLGLPVPPTGRPPQPADPETAPTDAAEAPFSP
jgi:transposase